MYWSSQEEQVGILTVVKESGRGFGEKYGQLSGVGSMEGSFSEATRQLTSMKQGLFVNIRLDI